MLDWTSLDLCKSLAKKNPTLSAQLSLVYDKVKPLLGHTRPIGSEQFTDHDLAHSTRVAERIGHILPQKKKTCDLNGTELYILLLAVLLHDSGMWGPQSEVLALPTKPEFTEWAQHTLPTEWNQITHDLSNPASRWMGEMGLRQLAATWFRINHPSRLGTFVLSIDSPVGPELRTLIGTTYIDHVVNVAVAHSWEAVRVLEDELLRPREIGGTPTNLRFLASLLRLGDLLDLGEGRISTLLWSYLRPLNPVSEAHWRKEHTLRIDSCTPEEIVVSGLFDISKGGIVTAEAYRLAMEWLSWIEREITHCTRLVRVRVPEHYAVRCEMGKLSFDRTRVRADGLVVGGEIKFELNRHRIIDLLGDEIYSSNSVFARELMQNAIDATRAQLIRDNKQLIQSDPLTYPPERPWDWPREITSSHRYSIDVNVHLDMDSKGREMIVFSVTDQGTGMTLSQIQNHFLQVGLSYYQSHEFREEFCFKPISRFGIGFLSCLAVAKGCRIELRTRSANEPAGLKLSIQLPSDHYLVTKDESLPQGTTVTLWIDPNADHYPNWDGPPFDDVSTCRVFGLNRLWNYGTASSQERLEESIRRWIVFPEFRIRLGKSNWGAREVRADRDFSDILDRVDGVSSRHEIEIVSPVGSLLGTGSVVFRAFRSGLPKQLRGEMAFFATHRGVFLSSTWTYRPEKAVCANLTRLPRRMLSAGRELRSGRKMIAMLGDEWLSKFLVSTYSELEKRSPEEAYLWRHQLSAIRVDLPARHYPVRLGGRLHWMTGEEINSRFEVLVAVPFGVAWKRAVRTSVPLIGIVDGEVEGVYRSVGNTRSVTNRMAVRVERICTGVMCSLHEPLNGEFGMRPFSGNLTYVDGGDPVSPTTWDRFPLHTFTKNQLPLTDQLANPWIVNGLRTGMYDAFDTDSQTGKEVVDMLNRSAPISAPADLKRFVIANGESWE